MNALTKSFNDLVFIEGGEVVTTSRQVAKQFGKQHRNVLRAIKNIECSEEFALLNFEQCFEINKLANGKPEPVVRMTKDGFMFLVMGFTGKKAAQMKEAFIYAFNWMADELKSMRRDGFQVLLEHFKEEAKSEAAASLAGRMLRQRRTEKPILNSRRQTILDKIQPQLFA